MLSTSDVDMEDLGLTKFGQFLGILAQSQQFLSAWSQLQNSKMEFCINTLLILLIKREEGQRLVENF